MEDKRLDHLLTYTTFHIGVYITLSGAIIGSSLAGHLNGLVFRLSVACFVVSGISAGVIGSNIPDFPNFDSFAKTKIGFWSFRPFIYSTWARIEHLTFWIGVAPVIAWFLICGAKGLSK